MTSSANSKLVKKLGGSKISGHNLFDTLHNKVGCWYEQNVMQNQYLRLVYSKFLIRKFVYYVCIGASNVLISPFAKFYLIFVENFANTKIKLAKCWEYDVFIKNKKDLYRPPSTLEAVVHDWSLFCCCSTVIGRVFSGPCDWLNCSNESSMSHPVIVHRVML